MTHTILLRCAALAGCAVLAAAACRENLSPARGPATVVTVSPESVGVVAGDSVRFSAVARNAAGSVLDRAAVAWSSSDTLVARVRRDGTAVGVAPGAAGIRATVDGRSGEARLVVAARVAGLRIVPPGLTLVPGARYALAAFAVDSSGEHVARVDAAWSVADPAVATVTATGEVAALEEGTAWVVAASGGRADSVPLRSTRVRFTAVSAGPELATCATGPDGAFCWGSERNTGNLGTGAVAWELAAPVGVKGGQDLRQVSIGEGFACALATDGRPVCWGTAVLGRLGIGTRDAVIPEPVAVTGDIAMTVVRAGHFHACGVGAGGRVWCWGGNTVGQLGVPIGEGFSPVPVAIDAGEPFTYVGAGYLHSCGLSSSGVAWCWGRGAQLGDGIGVARWEPRPVAGEQRFTSLSSGWNHTCGLTADSAAYCWGYNSVAQSGAEPTAWLLAPTFVEGAPHLASIAAGYNATCGLTATGEVWCWGWNPSGHLATGDTLTLPTPRRAATGHHFTSLSVGYMRSCGIALDGLLYCWGASDGGALGDGSSGGVRTVPLPVLGQRTPAPAPGGRP